MTTDIKKTKIHKRHYCNTSHVVLLKPLWSRSNAGGVCNNLMIPVGNMIMLHKYFVYVRLY